MSAPRPRPVDVLAAAGIPIVLAAVVNTALVLSFQLLIYSPDVFHPGRPIGFGSLGIAIAVVAWLVVRHFLPKPRAVMRWLVPVAVLASFIPDIALLVNPADRERVTVPVIVILMSMHVIVAAIAVPFFQKYLPLPQDRSAKVS